MKSYKDIAGDGGSDIVAQVTEQAGRLQARMAAIGRVVAVMSGKGGVGKSSLTVNLAAALALQDAAVGIVDADINGASIAKMAGVRGQKLKIGDTGILPALSSLNVKVMSIDLFQEDDRNPVIWDAPTQKDAFTWRGMMEAAAIREILSDTEWGELDYLLIDLPPGTDKLPNIVDLLPGLSGTVIVTIPSEVSQFVVGKSIKMAREVLNTKVIGLVENMAAYVCPSCGREEVLFPSGHVQKLAAEYQVPYLGKIPFDPRMAQSADEGRNYMAQYRERPAGIAINRIVTQLKDYLKT